MVVEDNDLNRKLFSDVLAANGFAVQPVADGLDALDQARSFIPNLIIMDIQLPNISGLELIGQIKRESSLRAAAASTAGSTSSAAAAAIRSGSCAHRKSSTAPSTAG